MGIESISFKKIKMLVLDVDGVMTDCRIWMDTNGEWKRFFCIRDGVGIVRLRDSGYKLAVITGSSSNDIRARVKNLGIHFYYEGATDKQPSFEKLCLESGIQPDEMAYVGDDVFDIPLIQQVRFGVTVPDAVTEVKDVAHYVTQCKGGMGAVREVCDLIYKYGAYSKGGTSL